ncbi:cysteine peptidase family C39 domain-containing protein [Spiroplasma endosymbiont of Aleiodes alternator]|uniref:cysteine peptidase family C39 domain-containing protein n=1 Tax=Spiroplasma endosymbiont of Aleiodes alternator TaxID=3139329 RepID=UPI003CCA899A
MGINLLELKQLASNYNLLLKAYNINFDKLKSLIIVKPLIIQIYNANVGFHFIVIYKNLNCKIKKDIYLNCKYKWDRWDSF